MLIIYFMFLNNLGFGFTIPQSCIFISRFLFSSKIQITHNSFIKLGSHCLKSFLPWVTRCELLSSKVLCKQFDWLQRSFWGVGGWRREILILNKRPVGDIQRHFVLGNATWAPAFYQTSVSWTTVKLLAPLFQVAKQSCHVFLHQSCALDWPWCLKRHSRYAIVRE